MPEHRHQCRRTPRRLRQARHDKLRGALHDEEVQRPPHPAA